MWDLMELLTGARAAKQVAALASDVASKSCSNVWARVQPQVMAMTAAEARGYIRAWAALAVTPRLDDALLRRRDIRPAQRAAVLEQAIEGVVEKLVDEVVRSQRTAKVRRKAA